MSTIMGGRDPPPNGIVDRDVAERSAGVRLIKMHSWKVLRLGPLRIAEWTTSTSPMPP